MEMTTRELWTMMHGMGFGALYLLACSGALVELYFWTAPHELTEVAPMRERFLKVYLLAMVVLAWLAVLSGTYIVYPWYRAVPAPGITHLSMFPQRLLMSSPETSDWHSFGMEWKEHIAWLTPISITMVTFVFMHYGRDLRRHKPLRAAVLGFALISFLTAGIAGLFGALIDKKAPVEGGATIQFSSGDKK